ncbi:MAG: gliding motility-associated C-terminal domain-containing protein [Bacteroidetes bacterium]|nr:gliding motility-associated C-terminal domain-containing protein [Bacteroidota bacterium]
MKNIFVVAAIIFSSFCLKAQSFWAQGTGGNDVDETMDICSDNSGNIISAGYFTNTAAFGASINLTSASAGIPDIYVSKSNSSGVIQWAVRAGGYGSDRALSVKADASGNSYITGFYYGAATFGTFTLNSANGSQDIFIAKLNSSGTFIWAVSAGGTMADIGNGIDVDVNGNVVVTGQFQGTATFGTSTLTSMMNPQTSIASIDIFTAKYNNNGNFLWVRQGKAKYTDRGLDVACDANGDVIVCGQFSDTILFNQVHYNQVMNAVFLIKYDANGNELWFRMASGTYSIAYSLAVNNVHEIYMTGDYQGNLAFYGPPNNFLSDTYPKCVFLVKYSGSGSFIWAQSESSNNYISSRAVALDSNHDPYIAGEFGCTLNEYADVFGQGTFNSIGYQDIFTVKYNSSGQRQWMRNFGGPGNDKAHGILAITVDNPVIAGSYEKKIIWATDYVGITTNNVLYYIGSGNSSYCSDPSYGNFSGITCKGFSDGFIAQAVDITRQPYDYYHRTGTSCLRDFVGGCIDSMMTFSCPDTLTFCGSGNLYANTYTGSGLTYSVGPDYHFQWSSSPFDTLYNDKITATNYYSVKMTTVDGCYTSEDTIYAIVHPIPQPPTITDDHGINNQHPQCALPIAACQPDTVLLTGGNINGNSISWYQGGSCYPNTVYSACYLGGTFLTGSDSLYVNSSGYYNFVVTDKYGCQNSNCVQVQLDSLLPPLVPISKIPDTLVACYGSQVLLNVIDSITGVSGPFFSFMNSWSANPSLSIGPSYPPYYLSGVFIAQTSGTYIVNENIVYINKCDTQYYSVQDTFYLLVNPVPTIAVSITGPSFLCQGDTIILHITYTPSTNVNTVVITNPAIDSIIVTQAGNFSASATITDTIGGCSSYGYDWHPVQIYPNPVLYTIPYSGLICPNDSVQIICNTAGTNYQWIGPNGILPFNTQSIYQSIPGFYHCVVTNTVGCVLTSNTIELKQYNTPYLLPSPSSIVCMGQSVILQVITNDSTLIQWNPPLSGSGTQQVVTQSGVYSCYVTMCGITTLCSMTVVVSQAVAQITAPAIICPGDSALLVANSGMAGYQWTPINSYNDSVYVPAGTYFLTTTDANGCTASTSVTIALDTSVTKPSANDTTVCAGTSATLFATGTGQIEWYSSATSTIPIYTGNPFTTPSINTQTTYYVATSNSTGCHSLRDSVTVFINTTGPSVTSGSNSPICAGDTLALTASAASALNYNWSGPNGFSSSLQNSFIFPADTLNSGMYVVSAVSNGCFGSPSYVTIIVYPLPVLSLGPDTILCSNQVPLLLQPSGNYYSYLWSNNTTNNSILVSASGVYSLLVSDANGCRIADSIKVGVIDCDPKPVNVFSPNGDGVNDRFTFAGRGFEKIHCEIFDRYGRMIYSWDTPDGSWDGTDKNTKRPVSDGTYYYVANVIANDGNKIVLTGFVELIR